MRERSRRRCRPAETGIIVPLRRAARARAATWPGPHRAGRAAASPARPPTCRRNARPGGRRRGRSAPRRRPPGRAFLRQVGGRAGDAAARPARCGPGHVAARARAARRRGTMMPFSADLQRALAHGLIDVGVLSALLALAAAGIARVAGVDPGARSRAWSAVAIVPAFVLAAALLGPLVTSSQGTVAPRTGAVMSVLLVDPLDTLQRGVTRSAAPAAAATAPRATAAGERRSSFPFGLLVLGVWFALAAFRTVQLGVSLLRAHCLVDGARAVVLEPVERDLAAANRSSR